MAVSGGDSVNSVSYAVCCHSKSGGRRGGVTRLCRIGVDGCLYVLMALVGRADLRAAVETLLDHRRYWRRIWIDARIPVVRDDGSVSVEVGCDERVAVWVHDAEWEWQVPEASPEGDPRKPSPKGTPDGR